MGSGRAIWDDGKVERDSGACGDGVSGNEASEAEDEASCLGCR